MDWEKANARLPPLARPQPVRRRKTSKGQAEKIAALCEELGRPVAVPEMAYDARIEIDRLERVLATRRRMA
jgi:hypothetical protein